MLDFRVVIAACLAGVVILFGGFGLVASFRIAHDPAARPANRISERPRVEPNASLPVVIETPATVRAPSKSSRAREVARPAEPAPAPIPALAPVPVAAPAPMPALAPAPAPVIPPVEARAPAPPPAIEITGTIAPKPAPSIPAPAISAAIAPVQPITEPVENPAAVADLPASKAAAKKTPRRPRPAAPAPGPTNPFSAIFGGFNDR